MSVDGDSSFTSRASSMTSADTNNNVATAADGEGEGEAFDEDDDATIPDEVQVFHPIEIIGISRISDEWMIKLRFEESTLSSQFFEEVNIGDLPMHTFAKSFSASPNNEYTVDWLPQWRSAAPEDLWQAFDELLGPKFWSLTLPGDDLLWRADTREYISFSRSLFFHLCAEDDCPECRPL